MCDWCGHSDTFLLEKTHLVATHQDLVHQAYRGGEGGLSNSKL